MLAAGTLLVILGLVGAGYGIYALVRSRRNQGGSLGPIPERAIHAMAGIRACRHLSQARAQTRWTPARKFLAVFS
jgi:hypothetical protein